jgi:acid phosphatase
MPYSRRAFVRTLFAASQAAVVGRLFADTPVANEIAPGTFNFVVIGDWGRMGRPDQQQVADQMAVAAKDIGAKFVVSVGDNFYQDGVASVEDIQWQQSFENVYHAPSLQVPWYTVLGNHDYHGTPDAELEYARVHPRWIMPARYYPQAYTIDPATKADFFYIDTTPFIHEYLNNKENPKIAQNILTQDVPAQLQWLEKSLAASTAPWKIVVGHHPFFSGGMHGDQPELIAQVLPLLQKYQVQAYFCGHDHDLQHLVSDKVNIFVSGGGSEHRPNHLVPQTRFALSSSGFAAVSLRPREMVVRMIDNNGKLLYSTSVPQV